MHCILSLILLLPLIARTGDESKRSPTQKEGDRSIVKPDWAKDMPPVSTLGYVKELERRIAKGEVVHVQVIVEAFLPIALSSLNSDFSHGYQVSGTTLKVVLPVKYKGVGLLIHHQAQPSAESCWRAPGCKVEFDFNDRRLEAEQVRLPGTFFIYDSDLKNVTLGSVPEKAPTTSVGRDAAP